MDKRKRLEYTRRFASFERLGWKLTGAMTGPNDWMLCYQETGNENFLHRARAEQRKGAE